MCVTCNPSSPYEEANCDTVFSRNSVVGSMYYIANKFIDFVIFRQDYSSFLYFDHYCRIDIVGYFLRFADFYLYLLF